MRPTGKDRPALADLVIPLPSALPHLGFFFPFFSLSLPLPFSLSLFLSLNFMAFSFELPKIGCFAPPDQRPIPVLGDLSDFEMLESP